MYPGAVEHYDVAIIGAGPAGSCCALALRDSGLSVVLLDKESFPRDKICGDAIPGPAFRTLDKINRDWGQQLRQLTTAERVTASRGLAPNGKSVRFTWTTFSFNQPRYDFDHFLFSLVRKETKVNIRENQRVNKIERHPEYLVCQFDQGPDISAKVVVGCDGANSTTARQLISSGTASSTAGAAVRAYFRGVTGVVPGENEFHFFERPTPGYFWIFPLPNDTVNVGWGGVPGGTSSNTGLRQHMDELIAASPNLGPRFAGAERLSPSKGFGLPFGGRGRAISGDRFLLCGDAAHLVSPLWGHGIDTGMESGYLAAEFIIKAFAQNNFSAAFFGDYDRKINQGIGRRFRRAARLIDLIRRFPFLLRLMWPAMDFERPIRKLLGFLRLD